MILPRIRIVSSAIFKVTNPLRHFKSSVSDVSRVTIETSTSKKFYLGVNCRNGFYPSRFSQQCFHTSRPCQLHPVVALLVRPFARVLVVLGGRAVRVWWQRLPQHRKYVVLDHIDKNRFRYMGCGVVLGGAMSAFYWQHCHVCPVTQESRFYLFQPEHLQQLDDAVFEEVLSSSALLKSSSPAVQRVLRVGNRLVASVQELASKKWKVAVVDDSEANAYCLSSGYIVVHTGMLHACQNDDQLAAVLAHELAHVLLQHQNLKLSHEMALDAALLPLTFLAWCLGSSDLLSLAASWLLGRASAVAVLLPHSRRLEREADHFGLFIMAMACFDVREASSFWQRMELVEEQARLFGENRAAWSVGTSSAAWLSTHPSHEQRYSALDAFVPYALRCRESCHCPKLPEADPRDVFRKRKASASDSGPLSIATASPNFARAAAV